MKLALGVLVVIGALGYGLAQILRVRRVQVDAVSERWLTAQERRDAITRGQFEGVVGRWPVHHDDAA